MHPANRERLMACDHPLPALEPLEGRLLLSGDVRAFISDDGNLMIFGDKQGNQIVIDQAGLGAEQIRVAGLAGTKVNGAGEVILDGFTGDLIAKMGDGNDYVGIDAATLPGKAKIDGGRGNNEIEITATTVAENLQIKNKDGAQTFLMTSTTVGGNMHLLNGKGSTEVTIHGGSVANNFLFKGARGYDEVSISGGFAVGKHALLVAADGGSDIDIFDMVTGSLHIVATTGRDRITLQGLVADDWVHIVTGKGDDTVNIDDTSVGGQLRIKTDQGRDTVRIEFMVTAAGLMTRLDGPVHIDTGRDNDTMIIGQADPPENAVAFGSRVMINGGPGQDSLEWESAANTFVASPLVKLVETIT